MQQHSGMAVWEFILFWVFTGSGLLGLPPGDRDPALMKAVPPQTLVYFEWASRGPGQSGAAGIDGFAADPEIRQFFEMLDQTLANPLATEDSDANDELRKQMPQLVKLVTAHSGCVFVGFEPPPADKPGMGNWLSVLTGVHGGLVLSTGDDTEAVWQLINHQLSSVPDFTFEETAATQAIPISLPGYKLLMHREGQRILFALGEGTLPRIVEGLSGRLPGLESNPRFAKSLAQVSVPRLATVGWVDGLGIMNSTIAALGPLGNLVRPILTLVGVDALNHVVHASGVDQGTIIERTFIASGGRTDGVMVLAAGAPIQGQHLAHIPADADLVIAASVSLKGIYQEARKVLATAQPLSVRVFDEAVKQLETELELKIVEDVLPAFGDVVTAFDSPSGGGLVATSLIVGLEVHDAAKAARVFERLTKLVEHSLTTEQTDSGFEHSVSMRKQTFLGQTIFYVNTEARFGTKALLTPSFCLTQRHLLISMHPQAMKAQLRYLQSKTPGFDQVAKQKVALPPGDLITYAYVNGPRTNQIFGAILPFIGHAWIDRLGIEGIPVDTFSMPSAAAIVPYFGDTSVVITRQAGGLMMEARNAPPTMIALDVLSALQDWQSSDLEFARARRDKHPAAEEAILGPVDQNVVPAVAEQPAVNPPAKSDPTAMQRLAPLLIKSLLPDGMQQLIPESALRQLEEGPSPETIQRREDARRKREDRKRRRQGLPPLPDNDNK